MYTHICFTSLSFTLADVSDNMFIIFYFCGAHPVALLIRILPKYIPAIATNNLYLFYSVCSLHVSAPTALLQRPKHVVNRQNKRDKDYQLRLRVYIWEVYVHYMLHCTHSSFHFQTVCFTFIIIQLTSKWCSQRVDRNNILNLWKTRH
jgi:hypothetical protein